MTPAADALPPPVKAAVKEAGLRYVTDDEPGLRRERRGRSFRYLQATGRPVKDPATLARIRRLAIPPAWTRVWIAPQENAHLQATGRDDRGRKQYRYHASWREVRDEAKYERTLAFGRALPRIRRRVARDLRRRGLGREKVLAAMVRLLETTLIRVGNEEYAQQNHSFGLSTMRDRHVKIRGGTLHFDFRGKSGRHHEIDLRDPRLAHVVRQAQDLPGQILFQYLDENGDHQRIASEEVNAYLRETAGGEFSAKDFRTWAGTVLAATALRALERVDTKAEAKKNVLRAIEQVAQRLGNTPAVCRKCYIHPAVFDTYLSAGTLEAVQTKARRALRHPRGLNAEEAIVLAFLEEKLRAPRPSLQKLLQRSIARPRRRPS